MIKLNEFSRNKKYNGEEVDGRIGRYTYGIYGEWQIDEKYDESTDRLYHTIEGVEAEFEELTDAEEALYSIFLQENKLTEDYI